MKKITLLLILLIAINIGCNYHNNSSESRNKSVEQKKISHNSIPTKIEFPSLDSLLISALIYEINDTAPVVLLCHQARYNKFEYDEIAPKLNKLGFNCVAIDQRSGGPIIDAPNETTLRAIKADKPITYLDAEQDIIAAIDYVSNKYKRPIILWGSSYSSTLALYLAVDNDKISAVISFSPGNYFAEQKGSLIEKLTGFQKPMFVTSSKKEAPGLKELISKVNMNENQICFEPKADGFHGSKALWSQQKKGKEYWIAINSFLDKLK